jgi:hypothetical protein
MRTKRIDSLAVVFVVLACMTFSGLAFNPAAHIYIADRVFPNIKDKAELYYGSIAPDLAIYVLDPSRWPTAFNDTHYEFMTLTPRTAFALGWLTHNEEWGADFHAHIGPGPAGYVIQKATILNTAFETPIDIGHVAVEIAVDILLQTQHPELAGKLWNANLLGSNETLTTLGKTLVRKEERTDWATLAAAELTFRGIVAQYAAALSESSVSDLSAMVAFSVALAPQLFGTTFTAEEAQALLGAAIAITASDYQAALEAAIADLEARIPGTKRR